MLHLSSARTGACTRRDPDAHACMHVRLRSCGAMSHATRDCMERPRNKGAKWTGKHIAADEKVEDIVLETYEARRDRWNGYDAAEYGRVVDRWPTLQPA